MLLAALSAGLSATDASAATARPVLLYTSDWPGPRQVFAVRTDGTLGQVTRGRTERCPVGPPCGHERVVPSPNGRWVAYWDFVTQHEFRWDLFVAAANGASPRRLATSATLFHEAVWSPDSTRLAYTAQDGVHVARADGSRDVALLLRYPLGASYDGDPRWSRDGRYLAYRDGPTVVVVRGRDLRRTATIRGRDFAWSHSSRWLAVTDDRGTVLVRPDGSGRRRLPGGAAAWSVDDRYLAFRGRRVTVVAVATGATRELAVDGAFAWSPKGSFLAVATADTLSIVSARDGSTRTLAQDRARHLAWSPSGDAIAYVACDPCASPFWGEEGDLRIATTAGGVRTLVPATATGGGSIAELVWTRPPRSTRYRPPDARTLATPTADGIELPRPVEALASDGGRVAFASCGHLFTWIPATGAVAEAGAASLGPRCSASTYYAGFGIGGVALSADRVAAWWVGGGNTTSWWLGATSLTTGRSVTLGEGATTSGGPILPWRGQAAAWPVGAGGLLAFSTWTERADRAPDGRTVGVTTSQRIHLVPPAGCPCPAIATSPGPLVPYDASAARILAAGENETQLLDASGTVLRSLPVSPAAAQLDGDRVIVAVRGELRDYDLASGILGHRWTLPDVPVAARCSRLRCAPTERRLVLEDAARGLAAYVLDGQVHVVRLADGTDTTVGAGGLAAFVDAGLVLADGARLRLVPFASLPQP